MLHYCQVGLKGLTTISYIKYIPCQSSVNYFQHLLKILSNGGDFGNYYESYLEII